MEFREKIFVQYAIEGLFHVQKDCNSCSPLFAGRLGLRAREWYNFVRVTQIVQFESLGQSYRPISEELCALEF